MVLTAAEKAGVALGASVQVVLMILLWACGLVAILLTGIWRSSKRRKEEKSPPAPPAWPVLGHLHLLGKLPHRSLAQLAHQYAPHLVSLRLGSIPFLVASSPQAAKLILHTHDLNLPPSICRLYTHRLQFFSSRPQFAFNLPLYTSPSICLYTHRLQFFSSRPQFAASIHIAFNHSSISLSPASPYWRRLRGLCSSDLFTNARIRSFQHVRRTEMHALLRSVFAKQGQLLTMRPMVVATSLNMVSRMTMGQRLSELAAENNVLSDIANLIDEAMHLMGMFNWGDYFPFLARFDVLGYERQMKSVGRRLSTALQVVLDMRRAAKKGEDKSLLPKDLLDVLLAVPDINDTNVKAVIGDMFLGGSDTTSIVVEWVLAELLANPIALITLQEELDQVVGKSRLVEEADIPNLPYLDAVVKESMRLHPPGPFMLPHESTEVCQVCDYIIPPKTRVLVNVWAIGRDPSVWENPLKFEPERFMPKGRYNQVTPHGQHFEFIPFGSGRRKCPAMYLALLSVHITVASLLQCFDYSFALSKTKDSIDLSEKFGLMVTMASPLTTTLIPRIDASLYQKSM